MTKMRDIQPIQGNILLVEDDELLSELMEKYLNAYGYAVTVLPDGERLADVLCQQPVDAILLDILLPGKDGLHWLEWLRVAYAEIPVILCSRRHDAEDRVAGLGKGAVDYIIKPFHPKEALLRLRNVLHKQELPAFRLGMFLFDAKRAALVPEQYSSHGQTINLTRLEALLLGLFFQQAEQTVTRDDIAEWLYGNGHDPNRRHIDMLVNRLRNKLGDSSDSPRYLHTVWGKGYRFTPN